MLTCLVIGDPHFKVNNVRETQLMHERICEIARSRRPTFIVCLGDILDRHESIHVSPLERSSAFLHELSTIAPLYVLIGNHDRPNNSNFLTTEHPFNALKYWPNTHIIDTTYTEVIEGRKFIFVPYVPPGRFNEALRVLLPKPTVVPVLVVENNTASTTATNNEVIVAPQSTDDLDVYFTSDPVTTIFAHQEFRNAKMGAIQSAVGDEWNLAWPYVISGHIHDYDQLSGNIVYVGTPIQHAFGDRDDKTVSLFTWKSVDPKLTPAEERIDLNVPKKMIIHLSCAEVANYVPPVDRQIKIVITGSSAEIKSAMKLQNVKTLVSSGIKVVYKDVPTATPLTPVAPNRSTGPILKYGSRLYMALNNDPDLTEMFTRLFGAVPTISPAVTVTPKLMILPVATEDPSRNRAYA